MSIIYEALKKVEPQLKQRKRVRSPRPKTFLILILMACAGFFIADIFFGILAKLLSPHPALARRNPVIQAPKPLVKTPTPSVASPGFTLNGVFFSDDHGSAIINNQIINEGDTIEGAKVISITLDGVELEIEGKSIKLSTSK